uniref:hypothetical protein n=1 Tax=Carnobacterium sp. PL12RED10 TaxID=2592351 RepID=UPI0015F59AC1|nr:hypothetical protein [Carnobacterium sp. PL12RED10]
MSAKTLGLLLSSVSFFDHPPVKKFDSFESHLFTKVIIPINLSACKLLSPLFSYTAMTAITPYKEYIFKDISTGYIERLKEKEAGFTPLL